MNIFLILTFLFAIGGMTGWVIEVFYRRFVSQKHWVNPGFLTGPCLPLYGESLCILYLLAHLEGYASRWAEFPNGLPASTCGRTAISAIFT